MLGPLRFDDGASVAVDLLVQHRGQSRLRQEWLRRVRFRLQAGFGDCGPKGTTALDCLRKPKECGQCSLLRLDHAQCAVSQIISAENDAHGSFPRVRSDERMRTLCADLCGCEFRRA
jgi:hypothetical protein